MLRSGSGVQQRSRSRYRRSVASAVSCRRRGFTLRHSLVPMPTGRLAAVLSAKAKAFRVGRNGERGEIASSPSGGRVKDEHSPKAKHLQINRSDPLHQLSKQHHEGVSNMPCHLIFFSKMQIIKQSPDFLKPGLCHIKIMYFCDIQ